MHMCSAARLVLIQSLHPRFDLPLSRSSPLLILPPRDPHLHVLLPRDPGLSQTAEFHG